MFRNLFKVLRGLFSRKEKWTVVTLRPGAPMPEKLEAKYRPSVLSDITK